MKGLDAMATDLAAWGRVAVIQARGRHSGRLLQTPVGYVEEPDGSLLVAATADHTSWARNLLADPDCQVSIGDHTGDFHAEPLEGPEHARAVTSLILRYGTPAEQLGAGPAFRLRPRVEGVSA